MKQCLEGDTALIDSKLNVMIRKKTVNMQYNNSIGSCGTQHENNTLNDIKLAVFHENINRKSAMFFVLNSVIKQKIKLY